VFFFSFFPFHDGYVALFSSSFTYSFYEQLVAWTGLFSLVYFSCPLLSNISAAVKQSAILPSASM
jgi:hypothetical protein